MRIFAQGVATFLILKSNGCGSGLSDASIGHCSFHIHQAESQHGIPKGLLYAISKIESGRKDSKGRLMPWPWTVNAEGQGYYFPTKEAAIQAVLKMQSKGIKSIDVGCMQVNLYHHPKAFKNLNEAFDPAKNISYAASFLTNLKIAHASWNTAVAHYHSANPSYHLPYQKNVLNAWGHSLEKSEGYLAKGIFRDNPLKTHAPPMNRIRHLTTLKTLALKQSTLSDSTSRAATRRVTRSSSAHLHRLKRL